MKYPVAITKATFDRAIVSQLKNSLSARPDKIKKH